MCAEHIENMHSQPQGLGHNFLHLVLEMTVNFFPCPKPMVKAFPDLEEDWQLISGILDKESYLLWSQGDDTYSENQNVL